MARAPLTTLILAIMILGVMPMPSMGEDSGGVQASSSTISVTPSNPVEGGSVTIRLTLYNSNNFDADDVLYKFYWNGLDSSKLISANTVDVPAQSTVDVEQIKSGLTAGEHKIWVAFDYAGSGEQMFYREIIVGGLADLEATTIHASPNDVESGGNITISTEISNTGSEDADSSRMQINLADGSHIFSVPPITAGDSVWINQTITAPSSGVYDAYIILDLDDSVIEAEEENQFSVGITVDQRMDLSHLGSITIDVDEGALEGPWTVSGILKRTDGDGITQVPMRLEIIDDVGNNVPLPTFYVNISGGENAQQPWSFDLVFSYISALSAGSHEVTAAIDPYSTGDFIQESLENDRSSAYFDKYDIPDISVDPFAVPSVNSVTSGSNVGWTVAITNSGEVEAQGKLVYTWEGETVSESSQQLINILPSETYFWTATLPTESGSHIAYFDAQWVPSSTSYDSNPLNSVANGSVEVTAQLRLSWLQSTISLSDSNGNPATFPLQAGKDYNLSINVSSQETGSVDYSCENERGESYSIGMIEILNNGDRETLYCEFTASAPFTSVNLVISDSSVGDTFSRNYDTQESASKVADEAGDMNYKTAALIAVICLILIAILVAAIILTREVEEEVERDIFDYCPACDSQLEGGENRCEACGFNLKKARSQFHECEECMESIPDLLSHCPYCGSFQDISKYFEKRERRVVQQETIAVPEEEEDPETIHAAGYEGFEEAVKEFGYDVDDLEEHWDENIAKAEREVEDAYDRRMAVEEEEEYDDEEAMNIVTTSLKSIEETFEGHDIDAILQNRDIKSHLDDGGELSASDADIRERLFEITGERGVLPGEEVKIGMGIQDRSLAGNALPEDAMDFSFEEEADEVNPVAAAVAENKRRRTVRRKAKLAKTAECGACGAEIAEDATECATCGAKFE